jgi:hypothetical protein
MILSPDIDMYLLDIFSRQAAGEVCIAWMCGIHHATSMKESCHCSYPDDIPAMRRAAFDMTQG